VSCVNRFIGTYSRVPNTSKLPVTGMASTERSKPLGDRSQSVLWSKTRELALGDGSGPTRRCVVELSLDQNPVGWRRAVPSSLECELT